MGCADSKEKKPADTVKVGDQLNKDQFITSANGAYKLIVQADGNVVLLKGETPLWSTETAGKTVTHATLKADGELVVANGEEVIWTSGTKDSGADHLVIQDDGNVVLYTKDNVAKWATNTVQKDDGAYDLRTKKAVVAARAPIGVTVEAGKTYYWCTCGKSKNQPFCDGSHADTEFKPMAWTATEAKEVYFCACKKTANAPFCDGAHASIPVPAPPAPATRLNKNDKLAHEAFIVSPNGEYKLTHQADGNVVVYKGTEAIWSTNTNGKTTTTLIFQEDGNLVLYNDAEAVWASGTDGKGGDSARLQDDGNFVIYGGEEAKWASKQ